MLDPMSKSLLYYDSQELHNLKGVIELGTVTSVVKANHPSAPGCGFEIVTPERTWVINADSILEMQDWITVIHSIILTRDQL